MGLITAAKGTIIEAVLKSLTHGDSGSTVLGVIAAGVLASGVNFSDLFNTKDTNKQAIAIGTLISTLIVAVWGYYIGKKKPGPTAVPVPIKPPTSNDN